MQSYILQERNPIVLICWTLALALLLGQSGAFGHDHDTDQGPEGACALCLFTQQSDNIISSIAGELPVQISRVHSAHTFTQNFVAVTVASFHSRAPPPDSC